MNNPVPTHLHLAYCTTCDRGVVRALYYSVEEWGREHALDRRFREGPVARPHIIEIYVVDRVQHKEDEIRANLR